MEIEGEVLSTISNFGRTGQYILASQVEEFESNLAKFLNVDCVIGLGNATDAIEAAIRALGLPKGSKILTTPLTAFATTLGILRSGCLPVYTDVAQDGLMDLTSESFQSALSEASAVIPVHLFGFPGDLAALKALSDSGHCFVIEDCAQSIGATHNGIPTGTIGDAAVVSFYPTKNLGALGDAGAAITRSPAIANRIRAIRNYGQTKKNESTLFGMNSRLDELHAAILDKVLLPRLDAWNDRRKEIAQYYLDNLAHPLIQLPTFADHIRPSWHLFPILVNDGLRVEFRDWLSENQIATEIHYPTLVTDQKVLQSYNEIKVYGSLENAKYYSRNEVSIPLNPNLLDIEVEYIVNVINQWVSEFLSLKHWLPVQLLQLVKH